MNQIIQLKRSYLPDATFGLWTMPDGYQCYTVERPWLQNRPYLSCIPEGLFNLMKRESPVVQRTSGGEFTEGWEVTDVVDRTFIMLHPANHADQLEGCIAPGTGLGYVAGNWAVTNSRKAFSKLMSRLNKRDDWKLAITTQTPQFEDLS